LIAHPESASQGDLKAAELRSEEPSSEQAVQRREAALDGAQRGGGRVRKERRKYPRIATDQVISFALLENGHQLAVGKDISVGGIRFHAIGCELEVGDRIRVTFNVGERTLEAIGVVTWATELDAVTLDIGLAFESLDAEAARILEEVGDG
jgi:hypothetical protein